MATNEDDIIEYLAGKYSGGSSSQAPDQPAGSEFSGDIPSLIRRKASEYGLEDYVDILERMAHTESSFNPRAVGEPVYNKTYAGDRARGIYQFMPDTGEHYGLIGEEDYFDAEKNIDAGLRLFRDNLAAVGGDPERAIAAHYAGAPAARGQLSPEVQDYVRRVQGASTKGTSTVGTRRGGGGEDQVVNYLIEKYGKYRQEFQTGPPPSEPTPLESPMDPFSEFMAHVHAPAGRSGIDRSGMDPLSRLMVHGREKTKAFPRRGLEAIRASRAAEEEARLRAEVVESSTKAQQEQLDIIQQVLEEQPEYQVWKHRTGFSGARAHEMFQFQNQAVMERVKGIAAERWKKRYPTGAITGPRVELTAEDLARQAVTGFVEVGTAPFHGMAERILPPELYAGHPQTIPGEIARLAGGLPGMIAPQWRAFEMVGGAMAGRALGKEAIQAGRAAYQMVLGQRLTSGLGDDVAYGIGALRQMTHQTAIERGLSIEQANLLADRATKDMLEDILQQHLSQASTPEQMAAVREAIRAAHEAQVATMREIVSPMGYYAARGVLQPAGTGVAAGAAETAGYLGTGELEPQQIPEHLIDTAFGFVMIHVGFSGVRGILRRLGVIDSDVTLRRLLQPPEKLTEADHRIIGEIIEIYKAGKFSEEAQAEAREAEGQTEALVTSVTEQMQQGAQPIYPPRPEHPVWRELEQYKEPLSRMAPGWLGAARGGGDIRTAEQMLGMIRDFTHQELLRNLEQQATTLERKRLEKWKREGRNVYTVYREISERLQRDVTSRETEKEILSQPTPAPSEAPPPSPGRVTPINPREAKLQPWQRAQLDRDFLFATNKNLIEAIEEMTAEGYSARMIAERLGEQMGRYEDPVRLIESVRFKLDIPTLAEPQRWMGWRRERFPKKFAAPEAPGRQATWHSAQGDQPVEVVGEMGTRAGVRYYKIKGSRTGIPENEIEFKDTPPKGPEKPPTRPEEPPVEEQPPEVRPDVSEEKKKQIVSDLSDFLNKPAEIPPAAPERAREPAPATEAPPKPPVELPPTGSFEAEPPEGRERRQREHAKDVDEAITWRAEEITKRIEAVGPVQIGRVKSATIKEMEGIVEEFDRRTYDKYDKLPGMLDESLIARVGRRVQELIKGKYADKPAEPPKGPKPKVEGADARKGGDAANKRWQAFLGTFSGIERDIMERATPLKSSIMKELLGAERFTELSRRFPGRLFSETSDRTPDKVAQELKYAGREVTEQDVIDLFNRLLSRERKPEGAIGKVFGKQPSDPDFGTDKFLSASELIKGERVLSWDGNEYIVKDVGDFGAVVESNGKITNLDPWDVVPVISRSGKTPGGTGFALRPIRPIQTLGLSAEVEDQWRKLPQNIRQKFLELGGYHMLKGVREFDALSEAIVKELGEKARPYLAGMYNTLAKMPAFSGQKPGEAVPSPPKEPPDVGRPGLPETPGQRGRAPEGRPAPPPEPAGDQERPQPPVEGAGPKEGPRPPAVPREGPPATVGREVREGGVATLSRHLLPDVSKQGWTVEKFFDDQELERISHLMGGRRPLPHQTENAVRSLAAFADGHAMTIADGTGTGKTYTAGLIIEKMRQLFGDPRYNHLFAGNPEFRAMVVVPNEGMAKQWMEDVLTPLGYKMHLYKHQTGFVRAEKTINFITYNRANDLRRLKLMGRYEAFKPDLLIFDESQYMKNYDDGTGRAIAGEKMSLVSKNTMFLSATPVESVLHTGYMTATKLWHPKMTWSRWLWEALGIKYDQAKAQWEGISAQKLKRFYDEMYKSGRMIKSEIDFHNIKDKDGKPLTLFTENFMVKLTPDQEATYANVDQVFSDLLKIPEIAKSRTARKLAGSMYYMVRRALDESIKVDRAFELAKKEYDNGKSALITTFRKGDTDFDKMFDEYLEGKREYAPFSKMPIIMEFLKDAGIMIESPIKRLEKMFRDSKIDTVRITGDEPSGSFLRQRSVEAFMAGEVRVGLLTMAAGGTGLSLHDKLGKFPRVQINLTAPDTAMTLLQVAGRTFRLGSQSNGELYWMFADTIFERKLANKVAARLKSMGALVRGKVEEPAAKEMEDFEFPDINETAKVSDIQRGPGVAAPPAKITVKTEPGPGGTIYVDAGAANYRIREQMFDLGAVYEPDSKRFMVPRDKVQAAEKLVADLREGRVPSPREEPPIGMGRRKSPDDRQAELPGEKAVKSMQDMILERVRDLKRRDIEARSGEESPWADDTLFGAEEKKAAEGRQPRLFGKRPTAKELVDAQRGEPEQAMLKIQASNISQLYGWVAEHVGDLVNRIAQGDFQSALEKVKKTRNALESGYGFEREVREQIKANLPLLLEKRPGLTVEAAEAELRNLGEKYANAHFSYEPINAATEVAQDAAMALGRFDFESTRGVLRHLQTMLEGQQPLAMGTEPSAAGGGGPMRTGLIGFHLPYKPGTVGQVVGRHQMIRKLAQGLETVVRKGRMNIKKSVLALFFPGKNVVRARLYADIEAVAHEMGHRLDRIVFGGKDPIIGSDKDPNVLAYKNELNNIASQPLPGGSAIPEGFAEFIRLYVTRPELAQKYAPGFNAWFDTFIHSPEMSRLGRILDAVRADYLMYQEGTPEARAWATIESPALPGGRLPVAGFSGTREGLKHFNRDFPQAINAAVWDDFAPVRDAFERMVEMRGRPPGSAADDARMMASIVMGRWDKARFMIEKGVLKFGQYGANAKSHGESLMDIALELGERIAVYDIYAKSKHALTLKEKRDWDPFEKVGIHAEDAEFIVNKYKQEMEPYHRRFIKYADALLQYLVDAGMWTPEGKKRARIEHPDYTPLFRVMDDERGYVGYGLRRFVNMYSPVKALKGSDRPTIPSVEAFIKMTYAITDRAEKNALAASFAKMAEMTPESGRQFAEQVPNEKIRLRISKFEADEIIRKKGLDPEDVPEHLKEAFIDLFRPAFHQPERPYMWVWRGGKREYWWFNPDVYDSLMRLDQQDGGVVMGMMASAVRAVKLGAVVFSPVFWYRSAFKDVIGGGIQSQNAVKYAAYLVPSLLDAVFAHTKSPVVKGILNSIGVKPGEMYWKFKAGGGGMSTFIGWDQRMVQRYLKHQLTPTQINNFYKHPVVTLAKFFEAVAQFGEALELMPRISEARVAGLKTATMRGEMVGSTFRGREATQDFMRLGYLTRWYTQISAFFGPNMGGWNRVFRQMLGTQPKGMENRRMASIMKLVSGPVLASIALYYYNRKDERWKRVPQHIRDTHWVFYIPGVSEAFRFPKPYQYGLVATAIERTLESIDEKDPAALDAFGEQLLRELPEYIPSLILPFAEAWKNQVRHTGEPLMPAYLDPSERYRYYTTETAKATGQLMTDIGKVPVAGELVPEMSKEPAALEHILRSLSGGATDYLLRGGDYLGRKLGGIEEPERPAQGPSNIPFARGLFVREPRLESEPVRRFYEAYKDAEMAAKTFGQKAKHNIEEALQYRKGQQDRVRLYYRLRPMAEVLAGLRHRYYRVYESSMSPEMKRQELLKLSNQMAEKAWFALRKAGLAPQETGRSMPPPQ